MENIRPKIPQECNEKIKGLVRKSWQEDAGKRPSSGSLLF